MVLKTKISVLCIVKGGKPMDKQKELIALLFAISAVSERLARNMTILVQRAKEGKSHGTNYGTYQRNVGDDRRNAKADRKNDIRVHQHI